MGHTDLQQDISRVSFPYQIERVLLRASSSYKFFGTSFSYNFLVRLPWASDFIVMSVQFVSLPKFYKVVQQHSKYGENLYARFVEIVSPF